MPNPHPGVVLGAISGTSQLENGGCGIGQAIPPRTQPASVPTIRPSGPYPWDGAGYGASATHQSTYQPGVPATVQGQQYPQAAWAPPNSLFPQPTPPQPQQVAPLQFATPQVASTVPPLLNQQSFAGEFPGVPRRFIEQIQRGEFINFNALYTAIVYGSTATPGFSLVMDENPAGEFPVMSFVQKTVARTRITDFAGWVRTWNVFLSVTAIFRPHLVPHLHRYQQIITRYASTFPARFWLAYDTSFRQKLANNPHLPWGSVDAELYDTFLRSAPNLPSLNADANVAVVSSSGNTHQPAVRSQAATGGRFHCGRHGHFVRYCPEVQRSGSHTQRASTTNPVSSAARVATPSAPRPPVVTSAAPPFHAPQRASSASGVCFAWNNGNRCPPGCRREHRCIICHGLHPRDSCPHATSG